MEGRQIFQAVFYGVGFIYIVAALFSLLFSLSLRFTSLEESELGLVITVISFVSLFAGGFVAGRKGKNKGWLLGFLTGLLYTVINFLYQFLGLDSFFSLEQAIYYLCFNCTAIMGGILGVNMAGGNTREA